MSHLSCEWIDSIKKVSSGEWNRLTHSYKTPILDWEWIFALEESGSISPSTGWFPSHLLIRDLFNRLIAAVPLYKKTHSWGEFVFDFVWADIAGQLGLSYYPKLVGVSPATPVSGYRFLIDPEKDPDEITRFILEKIDQFCRDQSLSSSSFLYTDRNWQPSQEYHLWIHQNYLWINRGYHHFNDYLADFTKNQRRNIRRERESLAEQNLKVRILQGNDITLNHLLQMHRFYENTNDHFGLIAARFLNRDFFRIIQEIFVHRLVLVAAYVKDNTEPVAMSMLLHKDRFLAGRYWGSLGEYPDLHFNLCYYEPIDFAIREGIEEIDPGLGSEHKLRRGFRAHPFYSYHRFYHPVMDQLFSQNIPKINRMEEASIRSLNHTIPFKEIVMKAIGMER